jgi:large subunit ribosomal protein L32e
MDKKKLLKIRANLKKKTPVFSRKDNNKKKRIEGNVWRLARGCDNKQRLKRRGHKKGPRSGFRGPVEVRGLHKSGLVQVLVTSLNMIKGLKKDHHGIIISSTMGDFKRKLAIEEARKLGIEILNLDADKTVEQIDARLKERQAERKKQLEEHKKAEESSKKDSKKKEQKEHKHAEKKEAADAAAELSDEEEKKKQEKEEKDKVLTMKQ